MKKLVYILPLYKKDTDTHHKHIYELIEKMAEFRDIFVIVEKGEKCDIKGIKGAYLLKNGLINRIFGTFWQLLKLRLRGYKNCYIHYSYFGVILAQMIFFKTYYWNCGQQWLFPDIRKNLELKYILHFTNFLVTGTNFMAKGYSKNYHLKMKKIIVLPNWINTKIWSEKNEIKQKEIREKYGLVDKKVVLFAHRLAPRKGSKYLPEIIKNFDEKTVFLIAGDGPDKEFLEKELKGEKRFY
jgi:glycosyltransferase involved in cell wall biosynthesis